MPYNPKSLENLLSYRRYDEPMDFAKVQIPASWLEAIKSKPGSVSAHGRIAIARYLGKAPSKIDLNLTGNNSSSHA